MRMIDIALGIVLGIGILSFMFQPSFRRDSTDAPGSRSGLIIITDHATGVQYVGAPLLGLTVRVDRNGRPFSDEKAGN